MQNMFFLAEQGPAIGFALVGGIWLFVLALFAIASIFWLWMLVDCLTSDLPGSEKIVWTLVILFLHMLGAILYFAIARGGGRTTR